MYNLVSHILPKKFLFEPTDSIIELFAFLLQFFGYLNELSSFRQRRLIVFPASSLSHGTNQQPDYLQAGELLCGATGAAVSRIDHASAATDLRSVLASPYLFPAKNAFNIAAASLWRIPP